MTGVGASLDSATVAARNATLRTVEAKAALQTAAAKVRALLLVANPAERPLALQLEGALGQTQTALDGTQEQLRLADGALAESSRQIDTLEKEVCDLGSQLDKQREAVNRMQAGRDFWRASAWKLALLALALGVWTLRRPLLAMCGGL